MIENTSEYGSHSNRVVTVRRPELPSCREYSVLSGICTISPYSVLRTKVSVVESPQNGLREGVDRGCPLGLGRNLGSRFLVAAANQSTQRFASPSITDQRSRGMDYIIRTQQVVSQTESTQRMKVPCMEYSRYVHDCCPLCLYGLLVI